MTYGFSFFNDGNSSNGTLKINRHNNSATGTTVITLNRTNNNVSMSGGLSLALKATSSSTLSTDGGTTLTTKNYVDALTPGAGVFLPLAGGTMTGTNGVLMPDNFRLKIGTSEDLLIFHDGTDSQIFNQAGDLKIRNDQNDGDIVFMSDNGSGGTTEYFRVDGGEVETLFSKTTHHSDGIYKLDLVMQEI